MFQVSTNSLMTPIASLKQCSCKFKVSGLWVSYIQNDLSWKSLLTVPVNLVSFCLASTFDNLPSPSNIQRWKISTDAACTLCRKNVCTTAHILGARKLALKQGRYTFRHNVVLREIVSSLKTFICSIESVVSKEPNFIKFVKKGTKVKHKNTPHVGTLHNSADRILIADLDKKYWLHIAYTEL